MTKDEDAMATLVDTEREGNECPKLNLNNYANIVLFALNIILTYGVGNDEWLGTPDNGELSDRYQTLVTPKSSAFSIWAVIFVFQGIFAVFQLAPAFRARPMVQDGVGMYYAIVCCFQIAWTFSFAFERIALSLCFMILLWISLMSLLLSQYCVKSDPSTTSCSKKGLIEFWFLRFPFSVHGGWITAATALNVNVLAVRTNSPAATQLAIGIVSLAVLHAISVWHLFGYKRPNYTIPIVLIWANGWIYGELQTPHERITDTFDQSIISGVAYAAFSVCMVIIIQVVLRVAWVNYSYTQGQSYFQEKEEIEEDDEV